MCTIGQAQVLDQLGPVLLESIKLVALACTERIQSRLLLGPQLVASERIDLVFDLERNIDAKGLPGRDVYAQ
jgi:hypothetical protein